MPRRTAWRMISRIPSTPAAWPSISVRPRALAQRRLPSMMIATWRGISSAATANGSAAGAAAARPGPRPGWRGTSAAVRALPTLPVDERRGVGRAGDRTGH